MTDIHFYRDFSFEYEVIETVSPLIRRIVARNPGPFTGVGTSTYVVGHGDVAVIDSGPARSDHITALLNGLAREKVQHILITHRHSDHWPASAAIQRATGAPTYAFRGEVLEGRESGGDIVPDQKLQDGNVVRGSNWNLTAVHTPGHTSDHLCFSLEEERVLFSGDHVMGWSTSVILPPDGDMGDYMQSLEKLLPREDVLYLPGHGPAIPDPKSHVRAFIQHRRERTAAILQRLEISDATVPQIVDAVYAGLSPGLQGAAGLSVLAHLIELVRLGQVECEEAPALDSRYRLTTGR